METTAWVNTRVALKNFMQLLSCKKCAQRPIDPVRYVNCHHLFCSDCIQEDTKCFVCEIPVQPADIMPDHITATLMTGCDNIISIIFCEERRENEDESQGSENTVFDVRNIFNSTSLLKDYINRTTDHSKNVDVIQEESNDSDKKEEVQDSHDETVKVSDSDEVKSAGSSATRNTIEDINNLEELIYQSEGSSGRHSKILNITERKPKNINKTNRKGETLLHSACVKNEEEKVKFLLEHGANPNTKDNANWTPLQEAISYGLYIICEMLLEYGALPNTPGIDNKTALHNAVINNRCKEVELLLRYGANPNVFDYHGKKPIDYCTSDEIKKLLSQNNLLNETREKLGDISSLNCSFNSSKSKLIVLACNLKQSSILLSELASRHKVKVVHTFIPSVTHVVVESDQHIFLNYDFMLSILHGKWILSSEWIQIGLSPDCKDLNEVDLEIFEIKCLPYGDAPFRARQNVEKLNPGLFNNCFFFFAMSSAESYTVGQMSITKKNLIKLCSEGGGFSLSREPNPEDLQDCRQIPFHVANDKHHPLHNCSHYIIYVPGREEPRIKYNMPHIKTLPLVWFIECIEKFTLVNPALIGII